MLQERGFLCAPSRNAPPPSPLAFLLGGAGPSLGTSAGDRAACVHLGRWGTEERGGIANLATFKVFYPVFIARMRGKGVLEVAIALGSPLAAS